MKQIFYIIIFIIGLNFTSLAQNKIAIPGNSSEKLIKLYPIPATSVINFDFQRGYDKSYTLQLYNFMGKKVYEFKPNTEHINLSLEGYYRGVYIYQLRDSNGKIIESGKFQVVR